jgi:hypothetical protein
MIPISTRICLGIYVLGLAGHYLPGLPRLELPQRPPQRPGRTPVVRPEAVRSHGTLFNSPDVRLSGWPHTSYKASIEAEGPLVRTRIEVTFANISKKLHYGELHLAVPQGAWVDELSSTQAGKVSRGRTVLAEAPPPPFEEEGSRPEQLAPQVLDVRVPASPSGGPVSVTVGYLERLPAGATYWLPCTSVWEGVEVSIRKRFAARVETVKPKMSYRGDLQFDRPAAPGELFGENWAVLAAGPGLPVSSGQDATGRAYWVKRSGHPNAQLLSPDRWSAWASLPPELWAGKQPPTPAQKALIVQNGILCPYSRVQFNRLAPGALRPYRLVPEKKRR